MRCDRCGYVTRADDENRTNPARNPIIETAYTAGVATVRFWRICLRCDRVLRTALDQAAAPVGTAAA